MTTNWKKEGFLSKSGSTLFFFFFNCEGDLAVTQIAETGGGASIQNHLDIVLGKCL